MPTKLTFTQRMIDAASKGYHAFKEGLWGGPGEPLKPDPDTEAVRTPYLPGVNMSIIVKEQDNSFNAVAKEGTSFEMLRILADVHELVRSVIDLCKSQIVKETLDFKLKIDINETPEEYKVRTEGSKPLRSIQEFFRSPDGEHTLSQWLKIMLEEILVTDALSILKIVDKETGKIIALDIIDGATIQPLLDKFGRRPRVPFPAYQQIIEGTVVAEFTADELFYYKANPRVHKLYGLSNVERIVTYVNIGLRRLAFQLGHYTEGNMPIAFKEVPETWSPDQIDKFQAYWDMLFVGNAVNRSRMWFVPGGGKDPVFPKKDVLSDEFDEWLARIICHCFSVSPNTFIKNLNRAVSEQQREQADEEGMFSRMSMLQDILDHIVQVWFGFTEIESSWVLSRRQDSEKQADIDVKYVKHGIKSIDEVRIEMGKHPIGIGHGLILSSGMIFLAKESQDQTDQIVTTTQLILTDSDTENDPKAPSPEEKQKISNNTGTTSGGGRSTTKMKVANAKPTTTPSKD